MYTYRNKIIVLLATLFCLMIGVIYFNPNYYLVTKNSENKLPNDIRWVTKSNEYKI